MTDLPPLPPPGFRNQDDAYTAAEMRAYGAACAAAEREACAKVCEEITDSAWALWRTLADPIDQGRSIGAGHCSDAIMARGD